MPRVRIFRPSMMISTIPLKMMKNSLASSPCENIVWPASTSSTTSFCASWASCAGCSDRKTKTFWRAPTLSWLKTAIFMEGDLVNLPFDCCAEASPRSWDSPRRRGPIFSTPSRLVSIHMASRAGCPSAAVARSVKRFFVAASRTRAPDGARLPKVSPPAPKRVRASGTSALGEAPRAEAPTLPRRQSARRTPSHVVVSPAGTSTSLARSTTAPSCSMPRSAKLCCVESRSIMWLHTSLSFSLSPSLAAPCAAACCAANIFFRRALLRLRQQVAMSASTEHRASPKARSIAPAAQFGSTLVISAPSTLTLSPPSRTTNTRSQGPSPSVAMISPRAMCWTSASSYSSCVCHVVSLWNRWHLPEFSTWLIPSMTFPRSPSVYCCFRICRTAVPAMP
mmetsp:Transcript_15872/g.42420  ORF Transcript_15872/g.42420 Transcript_15872/m.42420 type:complete len:394 (-) Transcript_15872:467-1648(-)